jgi:hypothetical protein
VPAAVVTLTSTVLTLPAGTTARKALSDSTLNDSA